LVALAEIDSIMSQTEQLILEGFKESELVQLNELLNKL